MATAAAATEILSWILKPALKLTSARALILTTSKISEIRAYCKAPFKQAQRDHASEELWTLTATETSSSTKALGLI